MKASFVIVMASALATANLFAEMASGGGHAMILRPRESNPLKSYDGSWESLQQMPVPAWFDDGKIGISPQRSKGVAGSCDADGQVLTIVTYNVQAAPNGFVNSMWEHQKEPYKGDVINSYNDGSPEPGKPPLGPFYEIETSSPATALKPGETMKHVQRTLHFQSSEKLLDPIARRMLGVGLEKIKAANH
ncbi:hypothetical protein SCARR_01466 [Pontiella sulfatireligans]|uniref:Uncharacterized protein n=1 Tax=Pontiella sulfatireligans TaxID=2750658 RepID=A0A6C2UH04_9BACT|nr:alpha-L-fucosidase [Pontiella sulfatireligans]VGO19408.1 hypothetical protein SCARR_01466 [Pontiella sulfatireligans]